MWVRQWRYQSLSPSQSLVRCAIPPGSTTKSAWTNFPFAVFAGLRSRTPLRFESRLRSGQSLPFRRTFSIQSVSAPQSQHARVRFESFELDCITGELFKDGSRLKLQDQPARLLILLVSRAGTLVTREEIQSALWEDGEFVEFEHAI